VRDSYQAREAIEGFAARVVAQARSSTALSSIAEILRRASNDRQDSSESAYRVNEAVHRAIVEASGNEFLVELFDAVWGRQVAMRLYAELFNEIDLVSNFHEAHASLLDALETGDGDRAAGVIIDHIRDGLELQLRAIAVRDSRTHETYQPRKVSNAQV